MKRDLRDRGEPGEKEWQEFRAGYAAARLLAFLVEDLDRVAPGYVLDLRRRLNEGITIGEGHVEEDPASDGPAMIPDPGGGEPTMMDLSAAVELEDQLFPDRRPHDPRDFLQTARGMVVVAFHSVLESLAEAVGATAGKGPLPVGIRDFLSRRTPEHQLSSPLADDLTEFAETRHIIVHNRAVVDEKYCTNVKYNKFRQGELRALGATDVAKYGSITWKVAKAIAPAARPAA